LLRLELDGAIQSSVHRPGDLISEIAFKSFTYSELAEYFEVNEIYEINKAYFEIQAYNYESKRLRDIAHIPQVHHQDLAFFLITIFLQIK